LPSLLLKRDALENELHSREPSKALLQSLAALSKKIARCTEHQHFSEQRGYFHAVVDRLQNDPSSCVVIMDFTSASVQSDEGHMLRDLILCVISFDVRLHAYGTQYLDLVAEDTTEDVSYVCAAWSFVLNKTELLKPFSKALVFSDGPSSQFKSRYIVHCFGSLLSRRGLRPEVNFWFAKHGRSRCDAHAAHVKGFLNRTFLKREGQVLLHQHQHIASAECKHCLELFQFDWYEFVSQLQSTLHSTRAFFLTSIPFFPRHLCGPTPGIFDAHQICYSPIDEKFFNACLFGRSGQPDSFIASFDLPLLPL